MSARAAATDPVAGIDIGGTKIAALIVDADGAVLGRATRTSSSGDQDGAAATIVACLDDALTGTGVTREDLRAVGVGVPGRVDTARGTVTLAVNLGWHDFPLRAVLEQRLGRPVIIENDVRAAAVGLHRRHDRSSGNDGRDGHDRPDGHDRRDGHGQRADHDHLAYLSVGTGIAAGLVLDGELYRGARGLAGEIGHAIVDGNGPTCTCGQRGCLEAFASGPAIARRAAVDDAREVYRQAAAGDRDARALVDDVGRRLAWAVHLLVLTYDVRRVVIGGGVSHAGTTFAEPIHRELARLRAASPQAGELMPADIVEILPSGSEAGAWGAIALARSAQDQQERTRGNEEVVRHG
jgi:glucokinase